MFPSCRRSGLTAAMLTCLFLPALCLRRHEYQFVKEKKSWEKARKYCSDNHGGLAVLEDLEDNTRMVAAATRAGHNGSMWIGLKDDPRVWSWSLDDQSEDLYNPSQDKLSHWSTWKPSRRRNVNRLCLTVKNGTWSEGTCDRRLSFVCYNGTKTPEPSTRMSRYFFMNRTETWFEAQRICRDEHTDLVSVRNASENREILQVVDGQGFNTVKFYIGLYRDTWTNHSNQPFRNWAKDEPRPKPKNCAAIVINDTHDGQWMAESCNKELPFVCQRDVKQMFRVKLRVRDSTVDLNDPAVLDSILKQLEVALKGKEATREAKISWIKNPDKQIFYKEEKEEL